MKIEYRWDVINKVLKATREKSSISIKYIEIGVASGECFNRIEADYKTGIDPAPLPPMDNDKRVLKITSDEFFDRIRASKDSSNPSDILTYHVALIDGLHQWEQAYRDAENCLKLLGCKVVFLHDTNPKKEIYQSRNPVPDEPTWQGDVWKAVYELRKKTSEYDVFTVDCEWGITAVAARDNLINEMFGEDDPPPKPPGGVLDWNYLQQNRPKVLNLVSPHVFEVMFSTEVDNGGDG